MSDQKIQSKFDELNFLFKTDSRDLRLILLFHSVNLANDFKCNGIMEDDPILDPDTTILPQKWEEHYNNIYSFRYFIKDQTLYFKFVIEKNSVDVNVVSDKNSGKIISSIFDLNKYQGNADKTIIQQYNNQIINKILPKQKVQEEEEKPKGGLWNLPRNPQPFFTNDPFLRPQQGGGMIVGPDHPIFGNPRNPGNSQPFNPDLPNIRFDPFGPGNITGFPDNDDETNPFGIPRRPNQRLGPNNPFGNNNNNPFGGGGGFYF